MAKSKDDLYFILEEQDTLIKEKSPENLDQLLITPGAFSSWGDEGTSKSLTIKHWALTLEQQHNLAQDLATNLFIQSLDLSQSTLIDPEAFVAGLENNIGLTEIRLPTSPVLSEGLQTRINFIQKGNKIFRRKFLHPLEIAKDNEDTHKVLSLLLQICIQDTYAYNLFHDNTQKNTQVILEGKKAVFKRYLPLLTTIDVNKISSFKLLSLYSQLDSLLHSDKPLCLKTSPILLNLKSNCTQEINLRVKRLTLVESEKEASFIFHLPAYLREPIKPALAYYLTKIPRATDPNQELARHTVILDLLKGHFQHDLLDQLEKKYKADIQVSRQAATCYEEQFSKASSLLYYLALNEPDMLNPIQQALTLLKNEKITLELIEKALAKVLRTHTEYDYLEQICIQLQDSQPCEASIPIAAFLERLKDKYLHLLTDYLDVLAPSDCNYTPLSSEGSQSIDFQFPPVNQVPLPSTQPSSLSLSPSPCLSRGLISPSTTISSPNFFSTVPKSYLPFLKLITNLTASPPAAKTEEYLGSPEATIYDR